MSFKSNMIKDTDKVYLYDGTLPGFYSLVYESLYRRELPAVIFPEGAAQPSLYKNYYVETDEGRAQKVRQSIAEKISPRALELTECVFLSCMKEKELHTLRFLLFGYEEGGKVPYMLGHSLVAPMLKAEKHLGGEAHLLTGFVRFSDYDGFLVSEITPKNFVLPFIRNHFTSRYSEENFLIYDKTHGAALIYKDGVSDIIPLESLELNDPDEAERGYRDLWKLFYDTVAIKERINPRCRMSHMPKRYWENMLEVRDLL